MSYAQSSNRHQIFAEIVSQRVETIVDSMPSTATRGNLHQILTCETANDINGIEPFDNLPEAYIVIERLAILLCGDILACWAEFESFQILEKVRKTQLNQLSSCEYPTPANSDSNNPPTFMSEMVEEIENDPRLFLTHHSDMPMLLPDAIALTNLETFVKEQRWYEMLYCLDLSKSGKHFIYYQNSHSPAPLIVSTALIQGWEKRDNWLTFDPFFQTENWRISLTEDKLSMIDKTGIFSDDFSANIKINNVADFEYSLSKNLVNSAATCEVLRLTVSGQKEKRRNYLYHSQKELMRELKKGGMLLVFTIIEQPSMILFYDSINEEQKTDLPYISTCSQDVNNNGLVTYKGFWNPALLLRSFEDNNFRAYNRRIIKMRSKNRETNFA